MKNGCSFATSLPYIFPNPVCVFPKRAPHGREAFWAAIAGEATPSNRRRDAAVQAELKDRIVLDRGGSCQSCATEMANPGLLHAHHVTPVSRGGGDEDDNVALLCPNCHSTAHYLDRKTLPVDRPLTWRSLIILLRGELRLPEPVDLYSDAIGWCGG